MTSNSAVTALQAAILDAIRDTAQGEVCVQAQNSIRKLTDSDYMKWKILVVDEATRKKIDNIMNEDDILAENVKKIESLEQKRSPNPTTDAVYLVSPEQYVIDCLVSDIERRKYRRAFLVFTSILPPPLRERIDRARGAREHIAALNVLSLDFYPQESHLILFHNPSSFPILYHPACNQLVQKHMQEIANKLVSTCVALGEYPAIRFYRPRSPQHEAAVLCTHLARFVQEGLDQYAQYHSNFPPPSQRPRGTLLITDRSMDLYAPLIHEFTYQAMVHELLPLETGDKILYKTVVNQGRSNEEEKTFELGEKDRIWVENRHLHMKDLLEKLVEDFRRFREENPQFADDDNGDPATLNNIKDMIAGLPQFQQGKELYSTHLNMAQECMNIFQRCRLPEIASVEQSMATGLDEDFKKPKNVTDQVVRLLDDEAITMQDRLRLILQYIIHRDGIFSQDLQKLLAHAQLPDFETETARNLEMLGARTFRQLKDQKPSQPPAFPRKPTPPANEEELSLTRFEPNVKYMLEDFFKGHLDPILFPYTKPDVDGDDNRRTQVGHAQASLRSAKPTWARGRPTQEPRQRVIVFVAGGATYSESRACYEASRIFNKDVYMASSHMITPSFFVRQVAELSADRRRLKLPEDQPPRQAPRHFFEEETTPPVPPSKGPQAPVGAMGRMNLGSNSQSIQSNGARPSGLPSSVRPNGSTHRPTENIQSAPSAVQANKVKDKDHKEKKHHKFFKF